MPISYKCVLDVDYRSTVWELRVSKPWTTFQNSTSSVCIPFQYGVGLKSHITTMSYGNYLNALSCVPNIFSMTFCLTFGRRTYHTLRYGGVRANASFTTCYRSQTLILVCLYTWYIKSVRTFQSSCLCFLIKAASVHEWVGPNLVISKLPIFFWIFLFV